MNNSSSTDIRCPYCWSEQNKQPVHIAAFPHPFLKNQDDYVRSKYRFIRPQSNLDREIICKSCERKFSLLLFKNEPTNQQSKKIFSICKGDIEILKNRPLFEIFLDRFFNRFAKGVFNYEIYPTTQSIGNFLAAFGLMFLFLFPYLIMNTANHNKLLLTTFDYYIILITVLSSFLLTFLYNLIKENDNKLSIKKLDFGIHPEYKKSKWGIAFDESFLKGLTYEFVTIPLINRSISRPTYVGLFSWIIYLIYKCIMIIGISKNDPTYSIAQSISIIPFWLLVFFVISYSLSYSMTSSQAIRIIIRDLNLKLSVCTDKDSYQELGELWEQSIMIFILFPIIITSIIIGLNSSNPSSIQFADFNEFFILSIYVLFLLFFVSWIWVSSFIDLKDKYQIAKNEELTILHEKLDRIRKLPNLSSNDCVEASIILSKIGNLLSKSQWPIRQPYLLIGLPLISPLFLIISKVGSLFQF